MSLFTINAYTTTEVLIAGRDLLRLSKGRRLHRSIVAALAKVKATNEALDELSLAKVMEDDPLAAGGESDATTDRMAVHMGTVRKSFASVAEMLRIQSALPEGDPMGDKARKLLASLFPEDTGFLRGTAAELDLQCGRVLERAAQKTQSAWLAALGCAPHMKAAKSAYADLVAARQAAADAQVAEKVGLATYQAAVEALREYARLVQAHAAIEANSLDRELLAPLANRRVVRRASPTEATAPVKPVQPVPVQQDTMQDEAPPSRAA